MPELINSMNREHVHEPAKTMLDLSIGNARAFKEIAMQIKMICHCNVYAFGSRVNGNYTNESDYDVIVYCDNIYKSTINQLKFNHKVDVHFTNKLRPELLEL